MIRSSDLPTHHVCLTLEDSGNGATRPDLQKTTTTLTKNIKIRNGHENVSNTLAVMPAKSRQQTGNSRSILQPSHRIAAIKSP